MVFPVYFLNYIYHYKKNEILDLKTNNAYKSGLFVRKCYYGLKNVGQTKLHAC